MQEGSNSYHKNKITFSNTEQIEENENEIEQTKEKCAPVSTSELKPTIIPFKSDEINKYSDGSNDINSAQVRHIYTYMYTFIYTYIHTYIRI